MEAVVVLLLALSASGVLAARTGTTCASDPPYKTVTITKDANFRYVTTSQCPPYANPNWNNSNSAIEDTITYKIPLSPTYPPSGESIPVGEALRRYQNIPYLKEDPAPVLGALGVLTNGVNIFGVGSPCGYGSRCPEKDPRAPSIYVDAVEAEGHTTDQCGGHPSPTDRYHVHSNLGFNSSGGQTACALRSDVPGQHSRLLGWLFDGIGIYGPFSQGGEPPSDLDECGGHAHPIRGSDDPVYHYHFPYPSRFPWTIGCFRACPEVSNNPSEFADVTKYGCPGS